jgi:very-short-patch-repair endonuclease
MRHIGNALAHALLGDDENAKRQYDATSAAADGFADGCQRVGLSPEAIERAFETAQAEIEKGFSLCESQIERMMLPWLVFQDYRDDSSYPARVHIVKAEKLMPNTGVVIVPQFAFAKYRADFGVVCRHKGSTKVVIVECDGVDFHDVAKDRERDAYFASWGFETIRVQGKEVNSGPGWASDRVAWILSRWRAGL